MRFGRYLLLGFLIASVSACQERSGSAWYSDASRDAASQQRGISSVDALSWTIQDVDTRRAMLWRKGRIWVVLDGTIAEVSTRDGQSLHTIEVPGITAGPILCDDARLYFAIGKTLRTVTTDGKGGWEVALPEEVRHPPICVADQVFAITRTGQLHAMDRKTGTVQWRWDGPDEPVGGISAARSLVWMVGRDGVVEAIGQRSGQLAHRVEVPSRLRSSVVLDEELAYYVAEDGFVAAIDASTGLERWRVRLDQSLRFQPAVSNGVIWVAAEKSLFAINTRTAQILKEIELEAAASTAPVLSRTQVIVGVGGEHWRAFAMDSGDEVWAFRAEGKPTQPALVGAASVYLVDDRGVVHALR